MTKATLETMHRSTVHALSPQANLEERAQQAFVLNVKRHLDGLGARGFPPVCARNGAETLEQIASVLEASPSYAA